MIIRLNVVLAAPQPHHFEKSLEIIPNTKQILKKDRRRLPNAKRAVAIFEQKYILYEKNSCMVKKRATENKSQAASYTNFHNADEYGIPLFPHII